MHDAVSEVRNGNFELSVVTVCGQHSSKLKSTNKDIYGSSHAHGALSFDTRQFVSNLSNYSSPKCLPLCFVIYEDPTESYGPESALKTP